MSTDQPDSSAGSNALACAACGFRIFNRRFPRCEACREPLPPALLYSKEELEALRAKEALEDAARQRKQAEAREARKKLREDGGTGYLGFDGGDSGAGGGE